MNLKGWLAGVLGLQFLAKSSEAYAIDEEVWPERDINPLYAEDQRDIEPPYTEMGQKQINSLVNMVNSAHSNVKVPAYAMPKVKWNYQLEADLKLAVKTMPKDWYKLASICHYLESLLMLQPIYA